MVRRDLSNRDDSGNFKPAYDEPLSDRTIGLRLFGSDQIAIEEAAAEAGVTQTELVREIVRREVVRWDMAGGSEALLQADREKIWNELGRERSAAASRSVRGDRSPVEIDVLEDNRPKIRDRINALARSVALHVWEREVEDGFDFFEKAETLPRAKWALEIAEILWEEVTGDRPDYAEDDE
jgi:hypothetical protein